MDGTLFRFVVTRPAQEISRRQLDSVFVRAHRAALPGTRLIAELLRFHAAGDRAGIVAASRRYIAAGPPDYIQELAQLVPLISQADEWLEANRDASGADFLAFIDAQTPAGLGPVVGAVDYVRARERTGDSLLALAVGESPDRAASAILKRAVRLFGLLERSEADRGSVAEPGALARALAATVLLRSPPYPPPEAAGTPQPSGRGAASARARRKQAAAVRAASVTVNALARHERALAEVVRAYDQDRLAALASPGFAPVPAGTDGGGAGAAVGGPAGPARPRLAVLARDPGEPAALLSSRAVSRLSRDTRRLLMDLRFETSRLNPIDAVSRIEARIAELAGDLQRAPRGHRFVMVGGGLVDLGPDTHNPPGDVVDPGGSPCPVPGDAAAAPEDERVHDGPLQQGPGAEGSFIIRMGDLELVEQTLLGYELGDAAFIENVLIGEKKRRTHRHLTRSEETTVLETARTETTERDTKTTERFDLQLETQAVVREDVARQVGVNVAGSYGTVEVTADARYARNTATEDSRRAATNHSRDVVDRAVSRVEERVLRQRTLRTLDESEETNLHVLDNVAGQAHVIGIYRWVNKVYRAQVINYGQRLMFELVVPEPAALYRFALAQRANPEIDLVKPNPPGFYRSGMFVPLQPQDLGACNYLAWTSAYGAAGVQPPPPVFTLVGKAVEKSDLNGRGATEVVSGLTVPQGYLAQRAYVIDGVVVSKDETDDPDLSARVGRKYLAGRPGANQSALNGESGELPASTVSANVMAYIMNIEVECQRSVEHYQSWQLATFDAIMTAYQERTAAYEEALRTATQNAVLGVIQGGNPLRNRQVERDELKCAAISIITGQHFDEFTATRTDPAGTGLPQADLGRTAVEGPFVRFIEQAFEWENMAYVFYPYFWSRKPRWTERMLLDDVDAGFGQFLRAGAARVIVPVRPDFEIAVGSYLRAGWPIDDEADPLLSDDDQDGGVPLLSLVAEVQAQQGFGATPGLGTLSTTQGAAGVAGVGTAFDAKRDLNREIHIRGVRYRIAAVTSATQITLDAAYAGASEATLRYLLGPQAVGEPWQVRVPTSLVILDTATTLHDYRDV